MKQNRNAVVKHILLFTIIILFTIKEKAVSQTNNIKYDIEAQIIGTTKNIVPFWMRSNQYGSIPLPGVTQSFITRANKDYQNIADSAHISTKNIDWGFGFEGRINVGSNLNLQVIEGYGKLKAWIFQLKAGRSKDVMGLNGDTTLTSGNFALSGNALGIPKIELSIPEYFRLPIMDGLISFKGTFSNGWLGKQRILDNTTDKAGNIAFTTTNNTPQTYFHQKSLYIRIGKPGWKLNLYGGFNHQVFWGNEKAAYGSKFKLSPIETFLYVATGKTYGSSDVPYSKIGNQLGSIDVAAEYNLDNMSILLYRQNFYDVGALAKLANIRDGLNGITLKNRNKNSNHRFIWQSILAEFFYSKDQAGYPWSIPTKSGDEDYYNNFYYLNGWSYNSLGLGTPLITPNQDARPGQASRVADYFINNRVVALHLGLRFKVYDFNFSTKFTYSKNYGTFGSSIYGNSTGDIRNPQTTDIFTSVNQSSFYLGGIKPLNKFCSIGFDTAIDKGKLLNNAFGLVGKIRRFF